MDSFKTSRCGFVVIKLVIDADIYFVMRRNQRWSDLNFIGGHERPADRGSLQRAAKRELLEEVPALRVWKDFELLPLTEQITHGPVKSRSAGCGVRYELQFFLVKFTRFPESLLQGVGGRSQNVVIRQDDVLIPQGYRVSRLVHLLDGALQAGLRSVPCSWPNNVGANLRRTGQLELPLRWRED